MSVPGSRRTYKAAGQRKSQILDCALEAFAESGYHTTSIADVCARAAIGRATLYQYFEDKRALLVALAERIASRVKVAFEERGPLLIPAGFKPSEAQVMAFMQARMGGVLRAVFEDAATARLILRAGRGADGVVDEILQRIDDAVLHTLEAELRAAKDAGVIRALDERFAARFLVGGYEKIILYYLDQDLPIDIDRITHEGAMLELYGLFPKD